MRVILLGHLEASGLKKETDDSTKAPVVVQQVPQFKDVDFFSSLAI
jgi:hypothetical protein